MLFNMVQKNITQQLPAKVPRGQFTNISQNFHHKNRLEAFHRHATGSRGKLKEPQQRRQNLGSWHSRDFLLGYDGKIVAVYPPVIWHNYGKSPISMDKSTINGHVQVGKLLVYQRVMEIFTGVLFWRFHALGADCDRRHIEGCRFPWSSFDKKTFFCRLKFDISPKK